GSDALQLEGQVRRPDGFGSEATEGLGRRERQAQEASGRCDARQRGAEGAVVKKLVRPAVKREAVALLERTFEMSERWACSVIAADRKTVRYRSKRPADSELRMKLRELCERAPAVRLSQAVHFAQTRRRAFRHQSHLPALSRGRTGRAQAERPQERGLP